MTETARLMLVHIAILTCVGVAMLLMRLSVRAVCLMAGFRRQSSMGPRPVISTQQHGPGAHATSQTLTSSVVGERSAFYASARPLPDGFPVLLFMGLPPEEVWKSQEAHPTSV